MKILWRHNFRTTSECMKTAIRLFRSGKKQIIVCGLYEIAPVTGIVRLK
jgi:hypothetical protein